MHHRATPLVSCLMPTADRPEFVPLAIARFLAQEYPNKELIIVDDGRSPVEGLIPEHPQIFYHRHPGGISLGEKRNHCVSIARANILLHWDDDDWTAPGWIGYQVAELLASGADVTGLDRLYFHDPIFRQAWEYRYPPHKPVWVHGATLCYLRAFWERNPFPPIGIGEDAQFLWTDLPKIIHRHSGQHLFAATVHTRNTSEKRTSGRRWVPADFGILQEMLGPHLDELRKAVLKRARG